MKTKIFPQLFIIYLRYLLGFAFVFASLVKIRGLRFTTESGAENPINSAWHFFETMYQSGLYWQFIGVGQFIAGALLLTQRYAKLGTVMYLAIIANIFVITISYDFRGTPIITGLMLLATILLVAWDWNYFKLFVNQKPNLETKKRLENDSIWQIAGLIILILVPMAKFFKNSKVTLILLALMFLTVVIAIFIGLRRKKLYH